MDFAILRARFNFEAPRMTNPEKEGAMSALWDKCYPPFDSLEQVHNPYQLGTPNHIFWKKGYDLGRDFIKNIQENGQSNFLRTRNLKYMGLV